VKIIRLFLFLIAVVIGISIGISNKQPVPLKLEPIPFSIELPLFLIIFICFIAGLVFGGVVVWWRDGQVRKRARMAESRAGKLEKELNAGTPATSVALQSAGSN
jgi:putative membrane protein